MVRFPLRFLSEEETGLEGPRRNVRWTRKLVQEFGPETMTACIRERWLIGKKSLDSGAMKES